MYIEAILLSEFNEKAGLRIIDFYPKTDLITSQQFSLCSDLILPREEFCNRTLVIQYRQEYFIVGVPQLSTNTQIYSRAKYIYSISIIAKKSLYIQNQEMYKEVARKLARFFQVLEEVYHLIYYNEQEQNCFQIKQFLSQTVKSINEQGCCNLTHLCDYYTFININSSPFQLIPGNYNVNNPTTQIYQYSVPITNLSQSEVASISSDLGKHLMEYAYKGQFTIHKIYKLQGNDKKEEINKFFDKAVQMGVVFMVDMFSLTNFYALTPEILNYIQSDDPSYAQKFAKVSKAMRIKQFDQDQFDDMENTQNISKQEILYLYFQLARNNPVKKVIEKNHKKFNQINVLKWIRMGQILKIVMRLHQKIVYANASSYLSEGSRQKELQFLQSKETEYITRKAIVQHRPDLLEQVEKFPYELSKDKHMNKIFLEKLRKMATIEQMCLDLKVDRATLLKLCKKENRTILLVNE